MKIKKGDNVLVISGKDRGKKGKVLLALPREGKLAVEGVNIRKKHVRAKRAGQKGQIIQMPGVFSASAVKLLCAKCGKGVRAGYEIQGGKKIRICKKCGAGI